MACADCFSGHVHEGIPTGRVESVHGRDAYISSPPIGTSPKGIIIVISDMFGWEMPNTRLLADRYAEKGGWRVYVPDFMDGHVVPMPIMDILPKLQEKGGIWTIPWKLYYLSACAKSVIPFLIINRFGAAWPKVVSFFTAVRDNEGAHLPIGASGFCWGGKHAIVLCHDSAKSSKLLPLVDAAFTGHPSFLSIPADLKMVVKPLSVAVGEKDDTLPMAEVERIKSALDVPRGRGVELEVVLYDGARHGFALRNDPTNNKLVKQAEESDNQAIKWFQTHFEGLKY